MGLAPDILGIHRLEVDNFRLLSLMRMLGAGINAQLRELTPGERAVFWQHALHGELDNAFRMFAAENLLRRRLLDTTRVTGVAVGPCRR